MAIKLCVAGSCLEEKRGVYSQINNRDTPMPAVLTEVAESFPLGATSILYFYFFLTPLLFDTQVLYIQDLYFGRNA